jgi:1-acyl-sn-glycerol-3-phosphate acyltransferase
VRQAIQFIKAVVHGCYEYIAMFIGLSALALICLLALPLALLLFFAPAYLRTGMTRRVIATSFSFYLHLLKFFCSVRLDLSELKSLRRQQPLIVVANHPSLLDAVILLSCLPHGVCVMKSELQNTLLFGPASRLSGYITNTDSMKLIKQACKDLTEGAQLLIFPEGTRTLTRPVNLFGKTTALIASRSGLPIQTVFIEFSAPTPYLGKKWPVFRKPALPLQISVRLGQKFNASGDVVALTQQLETYYQQHLYA